MEKNKYGTVIKISHESHNRIAKIAEHYHTNIKRAADGMINYFYLTGEDPFTNKKDNMVHSIKQLQNTFVSFIREHETKHLEKIVHNFEATRREFIEVVPTKENFNNGFRKVIEVFGEKIDLKFKESQNNALESKLEGLKTALNEIMKSAEAKNNGLFKKDDFTDLVERLKTVVNAIR